jgi:hypothetical protein
MSTGRVIWIIWCLWWAAGWAVSILFGDFFGILLAPLSALAILIPIGKTPRIVSRPYLNSVPSSMDDPRFPDSVKENYFDTQARNTATRIYPR